MVIILIPPGDRLPFSTVVVDRAHFIHTHRDRTGFTWQEPMTLDVHCLAVSAVIPAIANDNEKRFHHG